MVIHVVRSGESLFQIARRYAVTVDSLVEANGLPDPSRLVPGLALLVPTREPRARPNLEVLGYYIPRSPEESRREVRGLGPYLTYLGVFHYPVRPDGTFDVINASAAVETAYRNGVQPLAVITNFQGETFNSDLARTILSSPTLRARVISNTRALLEREGYAGVNVDWENLYPADRPLYNTFLRELTAALRPRYIVSAAVAPKWADFPDRPWTGAHDYAAIGDTVDFMVIMTYEWGWIGGPPMAVAPANLVRRVLNYALTLVPANKIMMGMNLYGYDWPLPDTPETRAVTRPALIAQNIAINRNSTINFNQTARSPWYRYRDDAGNLHEVWFEDARSFQAKYRIAQQLRLRGVSWWLADYPFPQNRLLVRDMFTIVKRT